MDKTVEQLFKAFTHLAREIQVYIFSGVIILSNIYLIDFFYYSNSLWRNIRLNNLALPSTIIAYLLGHISLAVYSITIQLTSVDEALYKICYNNKFSNKTPSCMPKEDESLFDDIDIFKNNKEIFFQFVERSSILILMRSSYSGALFIVFVTNVFYLVKQFAWQVFLVAVLSICSSIILLVASVYTERKNAAQIQHLKPTIKPPINNFFAKD